MTRPLLAHHRDRGPVPARGGERGAVLAVVAMAMVAVLVITATVIDLGYVRGGAAFDQSSADFAALAAGEGLGEGRYANACADIVSYLNANNSGMPAINAAGFCSGFDATVCTPGGATPGIRRTRNAGRYTVEVEFPVPNARIADPTWGISANDGEPCERMRVAVSSTSPSFFGGIMGRSDYRTTRSATVRAGTNRLQRTPSLWILDPIGCTALNASAGSARITAGDVSDPANPIPGVIAIDSDGTGPGCSTTSTTIQSSGQIRAIPTTGPPGRQGIISLNALQRGAATCAGTTACRASDVPGALWPQPIAAQGRATRSPVDWLWNCKATYPAYRGIPIEGCPEAGTLPPYIDQLQTRIGATGIPAGYRRFTTESGVGGCNLPTGTTTVPPGNWFVDCANFNIGNNTTLVFPEGNVVFQGNLTVGNGGALRLNTANPRATLSAGCQPPRTTAPCITESSSGAAFVYVRTGTFDIRNIIQGNNVMIYLGPTADLNITSGAAPVWSAPTEGPFRGLALWGEKDAGMSIRGGGASALRGTFFLPHAALSIGGGGDMQQQRAQFISYRLDVSGNSNIRLAPDPSAAVSLPPRNAALIR